MPELGLHFADGLVMTDPDSDTPLDFGTWLLPDAAEEKRRNAALTDLRRLKDGWRPDHGILAVAPALSYWSIAEAAPGVAMFWGHVIGHPRFPPGQLIHTSLIVALDTRELKWARTLSRFYVLGVPESEPYGGRRH